MNNPEPENSRLYAYYNALINTPRLLEIEFIDELVEKFGQERTKKIIRALAEDGFKKVKTMREALNEKGEIKPRPTETSEKLEYTKFEWGQKINNPKLSKYEREALYDEFYYNKQKEMWIKK